MTKAEVRKLVERYPFLLPRNVITDKIPNDYDYTYIKYLEIPKGWHKLFFQLCEDIRQPLIDVNYLDEFRFTQIKEKYNTLRCYHNGAPETVLDILMKYERMAYFICTRCGKPAVYETQDYILSFCEDCWKDIAHHKHVEPIDFKDNFNVTRFSSNGEKNTRVISFKEEWDRYLKNLEKG